MSTNYRNYVTRTLELARTITIKSEIMAFKINDYLEQIGYQTPSDERDWKYYQNLAGVYHHLDVPMDIVSFDTLEQIELTRDVIKHHPITLSYYSLDSTYYKRLVERYPEQELLIRGVLRPIEIEKAIEAPNHTIIDYDENLVEDNEENLIYELQKRVDWFCDRWDVSGYHLIDDLYTTSHMAILYSQLPLFILNIRLGNCHTPYVHSFHINEFFRSHNNLERYTDYLTKKQALFFYRNIRYIRNNAGRQEILDLLIQKVLTERSIGLSEYNLLLNSENVVENLKPDIEVLREPLNAFHQSNREEEHTFEEILEKERPLTHDNYTYEDKTVYVDTKRILNSTRNSYPTKVLESSLVDRSNGGYYPFTDFLTNFWVSLASRNQYQGNVRVNNPATGDLITLTHTQAIILYFYVFNKAMNKELKTLPVLRIPLARKQYMPTKEALKALTPQPLEEDFYDRVMDYEPFSGVVTSSPYFYQQAEREYAELLELRKLFSTEEEPTRRGYKEAVVYHLYETRDYPLADNGTTDYERWLRSINMDLSTVSENGFQRFSRILLEESAGSVMGDSMDLSDVQDSMIKLIGELSSYSIQFLREINDGVVHNWEWTAIRPYMRTTIINKETHQMIPDNIVDAWWKLRMGHQIRMASRNYLEIEHALRMRHDIRMAPRNVIAYDHTVKNDVDGRLKPDNYLDAYYRTNMYHAIRTVPENYVEVKDNIKDETFKLTTSRNYVDANYRLRMKHRIRALPHNYADVKHTVKMNYAVARTSFDVTHSLRMKHRVDMVSRNWITGNLTFSDKLSGPLGEMVFNTNLRGFTQPPKSLGGSLKGN